jgi:hypothetical protein
MYYPKSQIKTNLYTSQQQYVFPNTQTYYEGFYYETSTGNSYTGKFPGDGNNILITLSQKSDPIIDPTPEDQILYYLEGIKEEDIYNELDPNAYYDLTKKNDTPRSLPNFIPGNPTPKEIQQGVFRRYFCKKNNEIKYIEIDQITYDKLSKKDPQIAWDLYSPTSISWLFKGNKELIYASNKSLVESIERRLKWHGFSQYFQDKFLKYYLES